MQHKDKQLGQPGMLYTCTEDDIEDIAVTGADAGRIAYVTDVVAASQMLVWRFCDHF